MSAHYSSNVKELCNQIRKDKYSLEVSKIGQIPRQVKDPIVLDLGYGENYAEEADGEDNEDGDSSCQLPPRQRRPNVRPRLLASRRVLSGAATGALLVAAACRGGPRRRHHGP